MQVSTSTAELGCLGTPRPLPMGRIACENKIICTYKSSLERVLHGLRAQACFVNELIDEVWFAISLGLKSKQSPMDSPASMTAGVTRWLLPHWGISKVSLQLPGLKRLGGLIIFGISLSQIQWKSANGFINYGKAK